jgi:hypothetical protein
MFETESHWGHLGVILVHLGAILAHTEPSWGQFGSQKPCTNSSFSYMFETESRWGHLGSSWPILGPSWGHLGPQKAILRPIWRPKTMYEIRLFINLSNRRSLGPCWCPFWGQFGTQKPCNKGLSRMFENEGRRGHLGVILPHLGIILADLEAISRPSWGYWGHLGPQKAIVGPSWRPKTI